MGKAYEDNNTRFLAQSLNFKPIVPPKSNLIKFCINRVTTSNDFFGKLSVSGVFLLAMTNSRFYFPFLHLLRFHF